MHNNFNNILHIQNSNNLHPSLHLGKNLRTTATMQHMTHLQSTAVTAPTSYLAHCFYKMAMLPVG